MTVGTARPTPAADVGPEDLLLGRRAVLVPVKAFAEAKRRLDGALGDVERQALVRRMAERVLAAAAPLPVAVVCDDTEVATWARQHGALVVWEPGRGLNGAVEEGVVRLAAVGVEQVTVAHGDLPLARGLAEIEPFDGVTLVPDRLGDGTNVVRLPARCGFRFSYGPGSFQRHLAECGRLGLAVKVLSVPDLAVDVDWPADLRWT
jgi:2-phospho-L-lactate guanylyltransferase